MSQDNDRQRLTSVERYEIKAIAFLKHTGHWPPGKDYPAAAGPRDFDKDRLAWELWCKNYGVCVDAVLKAFEEVMVRDD